MTDPTPSTPFEEKLRLATKMPAPRTEFLNDLRRRIAVEYLPAEVRMRSPRPVWRRPALVAPLAVLLVLVVALAAIGPQRVIAAVGGLFGYIPGVGLVDRNAPIRVLAAPVSQTRDGVTLTVTAAMLTPERTHLEYRIFGVPSSAYPDREDVTGCTTPETLRLPDGTQLARSSDYPPVPAGVDQATLVIPCILNTLPGKAPEDWEVELRFVPAPAGMTVVPVVVSTPLPSATPVPSQAAPAAQTAIPEVNPLSITEVLDIGDKYVLMGEFRRDAILNQALPAGSWWALQQITIRGADGQDVPQSYSNDLQEPTPSAPDAEPWMYQLDKAFIPPVTIRYTGEVISPVGSEEQAEFEFDSGADPLAGHTWPMDREFTLGGYRLRLTSIESSPSGYNFRITGDPGASANQIQVEIAGYSPNCGGGGGGGDEFPQEFTASVCYATVPGGAEMPHGALKAILHFQALSRQKQSYEIQWTPETTQAGGFATSTPQPGVCLQGSTLDSLPVLPGELASGSVLSYEALDGSDKWGLVLHALDGSQPQVLAADASWGVLSPDGSRAAYPQADGIHVVDLASQAEKILAGATGNHLRWSPDGRQIAYTSGDGSHTYVVDADGSVAPIQISDQARALVAGWTADGQTVWLAIPATGNSAWQMRAINLTDGSYKDTFIIENGTPKALDPSLSPDGQWLAYRGRDNSSLYLIHPDGSGQRLLLDNAGVSEAAWSQSGWLGVSLMKPGTDEQTLVLLKPESCEAYRVPGTYGALEALSMLK